MEIQQLCLHLRQGQPVVDATCQIHVSDGFGSIEAYRMPMKPVRCLWSYVCTKRRSQLRDPADRPARSCYKFKADAAFPQSPFSTSLYLSVFCRVFARLNDLVRPSLRLKKEPVRDAPESRRHSLYLVSRSGLCRKSRLYCDAETEVRA